MVTQLIAVDKKVAPTDSLRVITYIFYKDNTNKKASFWAWCQ